MDVPVVTEMPPAPIASGIVIWGSAMIKLKDAQWLTMLGEVTVFWLMESG